MKFRSAGQLDLKFFMLGPLQRNINMAMAAAGMPEVQVKFRRAHSFSDIPHACLIFAAADVFSLMVIFITLQNIAGCQALGRVPNVYENQAQPWPDTALYCIGKVFREFWDCLILS
ncbi:hypothetical protein Mapa_006940 [Marchantia paleacea]|nr:hypothetical protein Mapa_006940 [Marchantia paleacea]